MWNSDCSQREAGVCARNSSADTTVSGERVVVEEEVLQAPEERFPCTLWCRPQLRKCPPAAHTGLWEKQISTTEEWDESSLEEKGAAGTM